MPEKLLGVIPPGTYPKADFIRGAFYATHKCHRSFGSILVLQNSNGSLSVRNSFDGACYNVIEIPTVENGIVTDLEYEFECTGFDPYGES